MGILEKVLGPKSKYDASLPYTYEARICIFEESTEYKSYFSDTICGLIEYLEKKQIPPAGVSIFEVYRERETPLDARLFTTSGQKWLFTPDLCRTFEQHYPGHIQAGACSFKDRDRGSCGP